MTASRPIAVLDPQTRARPLPEGDAWCELVEVVDVYDLDRTDLARRHAIQAFLDQGGTVVWSGQLFRPWLPGCGPFVPKEVRSVGDYHVHVVRPHPVFVGVAADDLTFRRGVAGFFARGHHLPPEGAQVVLALAGGEPVVYVDQRDRGGTVFAHAGTGLLEWAEPASTAALIAPQLVEWIIERSRP